MALNSTLVKSTVVAALGGLLFGFDTAVIAGATSALTNAFQLTPGGLGLTVSIALWGTVVGALLASIPGDRYGRRDSLRVMAILYLVSALGCAFASNWYALRLLSLHRRTGHRRIVGAGSHVYRGDRSRPMARPPGRFFPVQRGCRNLAGLLVELPGWAVVAGQR